METTSSVACEGALISAEADADSGKAQRERVGDAGPVLLQRGRHVAARRAVGAVALQHEQRARVVRALAHLNSVRAAPRVPGSIRQGCLAFSGAGCIAARVVTVACIRAGRAEGVRAVHALANVRGAVRCRKQVLAGSRRRRRCKPRTGHTAGLGVASVGQRRTSAACGDVGAEQGLAKELRGRSIVIRASRRRRGGGTVAAGEVTVTRVLHAEREGGSAVHAAGDKAGAPPHFLARVVQVVAAFEVAVALVCHAECEVSGAGHRPARDEASAPAGIARVVVRIVGLTRWSRRGRVRAGGAADVTVSSVGERAAALVGCGDRAGHSGVAEDRTDCVIIVSARRRGRRRGCVGAGGAAGLRVTSVGEDAACTGGI